MWLCVPITSQCAWTVLRHWSWDIKMQRTECHRVTDASSKHRNATAAYELQRVQSADDSSVAQLGTIAIALDCYRALTWMRPFIVAMEEGRYGLLRLPLMMMMMMMMSECCCWWWYMYRWCSWWPVTVVTRRILATELLRRSPLPAQVKSSCSRRRKSTR